MIPIDPGEDFGTLRVYGEGQPDYNPLVTRVYSGGHVALTKWHLSLEEREAILDGADLYLHILTFGNPIQPISLWIEGSPDDPFLPESEA